MRSRTKSRMESSFSVSPTSFLWAQFFAWRCSLAVPTSIADLISLRKATSAFLRAILDSLEWMPFGTRFMARELYRALQARFPDAAEQECLRVVGNLLYYRLLQPAILCATAFPLLEEHCLRPLC